VRTAQEYGSPARLVETVVQVNDTRKGAMASRVIQACGGSVRGKTVAILGVAFKPNTDDMRAAPSLAIVPALQDAGAVVRAFDPAAMHEAESMLPGVSWCADAYDAAIGADVLVLITEWNEFRALDFTKLADVMRAKVLVDLRNVYRPEVVRAAGFAYSSIGRS
jgi:UDPglucose 6-dehydrogenase